MEFILYAPNVHTGGGLVLLEGLLRDWPKNCGLTAFLDERARGQLRPGARMIVHWVRPEFRARLRAEISLPAASSENCTVLCFHGLPPLLPIAGKVVIFLQNRLLLGFHPLSGHRLKTALRLTIERLICRVFRHRVSRYLVQTPSMARDLTRWYGSAERGLTRPPITVLPFIDAWPLVRQAADEPQQAPTWDFVYVADGQAHKNHRTLFAAWQLLAEQGLKPRLALTLGPRDQLMIDAMNELKRHTGAELHNLGHLPRDRVLALYQDARALIFPSTTESFGLPLVEAQHLGLPVLAPEADYVRDVCVPSQTFDPLSAVSIARAVRRFLGQVEPVLHVGLPSDFWAALLAPNNTAKAR
jgi:glycosyltransferase involved in cell wall biosynthesis